MVPRTTLALAVFLAAPQALAETHAVAPAGGGLGPLDVTVDLATGMVDANDRRIPITLNRAELPSSDQVAAEAVPIGAGRHVVHVVVPAKDRDGVAWEALVAAGQKEPIFAGITGYVAGDPGERTGKSVRIVKGSGSSFVLVGDVREDLRICGQASTQLDPQALYPSSLELRPATVQRLDPDQLSGAEPVTATDAGHGAAPALAQLLVARGSSVPGSRGAELTDGDSSTVWSERRPHMGQGEFVVMAAPKDVPISRMQVVVSPPSPAPNGAAPRTFYLVTTTETFEVTLPSDGWAKPGEAYEIVFPHPIEASCVALVLSDAYTRGLAHPDVSVSELVAYSEFDGPGATLEAVAKKLSSERGIAAAQVLERAGARALDAARNAYGDLDARGRALAIDVAASHDDCVEAAPLLVRGLCERAGQAPRKAREKLERCKGAAATLASAIRQEAATRACVAPTLAAIAGPDALEPLADALSVTRDADTDTREVLRRSFALALESAPKERLAALVEDARRTPVARLEMMRAAGPRVAEVKEQCDRALADVLDGTPPMRVRYLALGPLGALARAGDATAAARIAGAIAHDPEWPVRARAAELGAGVAGAQSALLGATRDAEPRVREAALQALASSPVPPAFDAARAVLSSDGWSFVKAQALGVLAHAPASTEVDDALRAAMKDPATRVRAVALNAVALRHAQALHGAVRERLDDEHEDAEVRAAAAAALGAVCDASSADRLTELARSLGAPGTAEEDQQIAWGALLGLAALHPSDLGERLAPLLSVKGPPDVRAAAEKAMAAPGMCR